MASALREERLQTYADLLTWPEDERWELINGVSMMMAPPRFVHQRIASNLERLLNDALETRDPARAAYQRGGLNLKRTVANYDPETDVVMVDVVVVDLVPQDARSNDVTRRKASDV